ncbi:PREDICTED: UDP-glucuronosyltransferase 3A1-like [Vollenhovia emeryi]|uniref:UDP-glucuronosyltransferase 3A1-like n=1 Tax=Vollenhovia emeryi TaxID=411798 RepID=UPI0005F5488B|nr:PREDICTED: UDP-glucuronosyltransferase 3A1-like [Vollenhovia emeryi]
MKVLLPVFLVILACDQIANGLRILGVFPFHGKSHFIMQEALMKDLARRGHQVDVVTHFPLEKPIPNYTDISIKGTLPRVVNNVTAEEAQAFSNPSIAYFVAMAGHNICQLLSHPKMQQLIKNPPQDPPYDMVIVEVCSMLSNIYVQSFLRMHKNVMQENSYYFDLMYRLYEKNIPSSFKLLLVSRIVHLPIAMFSQRRKKNSVTMNFAEHKNIRAFITHGGLFGTQEAIYCGVPMIGIPLFGDQRNNILNYVNKKVAISLNSVSEVTEEKLTSAINTILKDPSYRENIQTLSKKFLDRPISALDESIFWVEYIGKYGNVIQSPALQLYWWQHCLLDVYALIFVVIITVLYIVLFVLRKLKRLLFGSRTPKKDNAAMKSKKNK